MDEKTTYLLAAAILAVVISLPVSYLTSVYLVPHPAVYTTAGVREGYFVPSFRTETTPVNSFYYAYRLALENGSIATVGATRANTTAQSASITSSVTANTVAVVLVVTFQGNATGDSVAIWTLADLTTKYTVYSPIASKNVTQTVILPYNYLNDGKVYWDLSSSNLNLAVTIQLWGYFETAPSTVR